MGSSSNDDAVEEAQKTEAEHNAQVAAAIAKIDALFGSPQREAQYADYLGAHRDLYSDEVNRQNTEATRNNKFALARNGLTGGSVASDTGRRMGIDYTKALTQAERLAQGDEAALRNQDQQSRLSLIQMAQSGLDATTGVQNAATALQNNLLSSQQGQGVRALGDVFKNYTSFYQKSLDDKARRQGDQYALDALYKPSIYSGYKF
jgi:acyl-CoA synthetase (AMP-forming)/AMP-acid ligase II